MRLCDGTTQKLLELGRGERNTIGGRLDAALLCREARNQEIGWQQQREPAPVGSAFAEIVVGDDANAMALKRENAAGQPNDISTEVDGKRFVPKPSLVAKLAERIKGSAPSAKAEVFLEGIGKGLGSGRENADGRAGEGGEREGKSGRGAKGPGLGFGEEMGVGGGVGQGVLVSWIGGKEESIGFS